MTKTVVVLGGAFAGIQVAHRLLKYTRPHVKDLKVILVSKNSHFYWNLAAVRAIVPGVLKEEDYTRPIAPGFAKYPGEAFEFIIGSAEAVDTSAKTVKIAVGGDEERELSYDYLVVATGTRNAGATDVPWKNNGTHEEITALLDATREKVKAASHIVVAGAGATGVETAAELGFEYGNPKDPAIKKKTIVLLSADETVLNGDSIANSVTNELKKLNVTVRGSARVASANPSPDGDGKTAVVLENGETILTDLYLPTMGMKPNTEFLPSALLTDKGFVDIDDFYAVKGGAEGVWAAGDVVWKPRGSFVHADKQAAGVAKNIDAVLRGKAQSPVKTIPIDVLLVATGRARGAGRMGPVKAFSFLVYSIKGKTLGVERLPAWVDGSLF